MIIILITGICLAINMGAGGFSIAFAPSCGSGILKRRQAILLYTVFSIAGAVLIGPGVVRTLTGKIAGTDTGGLSGILILAAALFTMLAANLLRIPQSTSFVMVSAFAGSGIYYHTVNWFTLGNIFFMAVVFSVLAFACTRLLTGVFYPPRSTNLHFYEKALVKQKRLRIFIIITNCYAAFAVGSNNVANAVAPLIIGGVRLPVALLLLFFGPLFGLGAWIFGRGILKTVSEEIVPIGEMSAAVVSLVTSSFVITASLLGLPAPYVQFTTFAMLAVSCLKDGLAGTLQKLTVKKIFSVWLAIPLLTGCISFILHRLFI